LRKESDSNDSIASDRIDKITEDGSNPNKVVIKRTTNVCELVDERDEFSNNTTIIKKHSNPDMSTTPVSQSIDELDSPFGANFQKDQAASVNNAKAFTQTLETISDEIEVDGFAQQDSQTSKNTLKLHTDSDQNKETSISGFKNKLSPPQLSAHPEKQRSKKDLNKEKVEQYLTRIPNLEFVLSQTLVLPNSLFE